MKTLITFYLNCVTNLKKSSGTACSHEDIHLHEQKSGLFLPVNLLPILADERFPKDDNQFPLKPVRDVTDDDDEEDEERTTVLDSLLLWTYFITSKI